MSMENVKEAFPAMPCPLPNDFFKKVEERNKLPVDVLENRIIEAGNSRPGNLEGYDCPKCLNRGYIWVSDEHGRKTVDCSCLVIRQGIKRLHNSGFGDLINRYTFDNWYCDFEWQYEALCLVQEFIRKKRGWLFAFGRPGTGKSHLCTATCVQLLHEGVDVRYIVWTDFAVKAKANVMDDEAYSRIVSPLKTVDVLYIDDFFKPPSFALYGDKMSNLPTKADGKLAFEIINSRYNDDRKITLISSEWTISELMDFDEGTGSRIYEKTKGFLLDFTGKPNWRIRH